MSAISPVHEVDLLQSCFYPVQPRQTIREEEKEWSETETIASDITTMDDQQARARGRFGPLPPSLAHALKTGTLSHEEIQEISSLDSFRQADICTLVVLRQDHSVDGICLQSFAEERLVENVHRNPYPEFTGRSSAVVPPRLYSAVSDCIGCYILGVLPGDDVRYLGISLTSTSSTGEEFAEVFFLDTDCQWNRIDLLGQMRI